MKEQKNPQSLKWRFDKGEYFNIYIYSINEVTQQTQKYLL